MSRKLTVITFYQNTPFTDFQNYIDFGSNEKRDAFFQSHYDPKKIQTDFNMVRDRLTLRVSATVANWAWLSECNYLSFENDFDGITYYAQVVEANYLSNGVVRLSLVIDGLTTFCQGDLKKYAKNVMIERQHLPERVFQDNIDKIRNDDDAIRCSSEKFIKQENYSLTDLNVIFRTSVDLSSDFGTVDSPKIVTSKGVVYDKIVSPQNIYMTPYDKYNAFMKEIEKYPWIGQNITSVLLVPKRMFDNSDFEKTKLNGSDFGDLYIFKNGNSKNIDDIPSISKSPKELLAIFGLQNHPELLKNGYCGVTITNHQGQEINVNFGNLDTVNGLQLAAHNMVGYSNQLYFFIKGYKSRGENTIGNLPQGSYLDDSIAYTKFDSAPLLTDQYRLLMAQTANNRRLAQSNLISGQAKTILDNNAPIQDRFFSAVSLTSDASIGAITGKFKDEWQYYRQLNADMADKKLTPPSVSEMSTENSFPIKEGFFGITVKYSRVNDKDLDLAKNYHAHYGYQWVGTGNLESTESMQFLNYAKFSGNWIIDDRHVPQSIMEQIRAQFENGVKIWHNPDNLANPYKQDIKDINIWSN